MIAKKGKELGKRIFWTMAVTLVLSIPMIAFVETLVGSSDTFDGLIPTADGWLALSAMAVFSLVVLGMFFLRVWPALVDLVRAIWQARREANGDMFP